MSTYSEPDYSAVVSATGFLRPRASRSIETFHDHLITSNRILALVGAGLSAPSGIPTYRGAGGVWQTYDVTQLCTPNGFQNDPVLVWTFELERRRMIENAQPNAAHYALASLAKRNANSLTLTMNVDDLSERVEHPTPQLQHLHGIVFNVRCIECELHLSGDGANAAIQKLLQHNASTALKLADIPNCPEVDCGGLLRPGIVWFTESIPQSLMKCIYDWINDPATIDTMLVIGTSALVYPATAYIEAARRKGARVAVVNIEQEDPSLLGLEEQDWYFRGDAAELVPRILEPLIGGSEVSSVVN
jgi:NAD-dependent deacetylase sirtuin 5